MSSPKRTVLITGCSEGGLGEEIAKQYHAKGLRVFATARRPESMKSLKALGVEIFALDVTNTESISALKAQIEELTGGSLDILVNNAGVPSTSAAVDASIDDVRKLYEVNVFAVMAMVKAFVSLLIASGDGCVVNIGSLSAITPLPFGSIYGSSKAALASYSDVLRIELAPFGVRVLVVLAGNVRSNIGGHYLPMPENSIYKPIEPEFRYNRLDHFHDGAPDRKPVVADIVRESLRRKPRAWLWVGKNWLVVWLISTFFSRTAFDSIMSKKFGLSKLALILRSRKAKTA
ncbi:hypothetical protein EIP91_008773 [Steccherinum ochraceum]|uniref:NADPH-dependent 1-acyldihydroxyacetone phosphate reductase n=1 Tax=Steccherinum ochraceum TaxID=92696 RepID=A0A4R0R2E4_9APHY|nr:hypothetical protein EIP91_008773 [Steccherinum ochraceum]